MALINRGKFLGTSSIAAALVFAQAVPAYAQQQTYEFNIEAQDLGSALRAFARTSRQQVSFDDQEVRGKKSPPLKGSYSVDDGLERILAGSGLIYKRGKSGILIVQRAASVSTATQSATSFGDDDGPAGTAGASDRGISEILVVGSRSQNVDIRRTQDDPQPYVVFTSKDIEDSQASNLDEFLKTRLPSNATRDSASHEVYRSEAAFNSNISKIDLRGLGAKQTLILVDGRRLPRQRQQGSDLSQGDINGIPLSAIERIEVLPATAGGIYGGGAVGGVINIIRKHNYAGLDARLIYEGTFRGGGENYRAELSGGFSIGKRGPQISFSTSYADGKPLYAGDNDLTDRGRRFLYQNNPTLLVGATPNIQSSNGSNLVLKDGTQLNSPYTYIPYGYTGTASDGGAALVANAGMLNFDLSEGPTGKKATLRNYAETISADLNIRQKITDKLELFLDGGYSQSDSRVGALYGATSTSLPASSASNPFQQQIGVAFPNIDLNADMISQTRQYRFAGGLIWRLFGDWAVTPEYSWSRMRWVSRFFTDPYENQLTLDLRNSVVRVLQDPAVAPYDFSAYRKPGDHDSEYGPYTNTQQVGTLRAAGSIVDLPAGPITASFLLESREERLNEGRQNLSLFVFTGFSFINGSQNVVYPPAWQNVDSAYGEFSVPLFSEKNAIPGIRELQLQASVRHDRYSSNIAQPTQYNFGTTPTINRLDVDYASTDYTLAAKWSPIKGVSLRGSYSTGFLPPTLTQYVPSQTVISASASRNLFDPRRGGERVSQSYISYRSGDLALRPELSKSLALGLIFEPAFLPGLRASLDYVQIRKTDEIYSALTESLLLTYEDVFPDRVLRGDPLPGDPAGYAGPIQGLSTAPVNIAKSTVRAWDFRVDYDVALAPELRARFYVVGTHTALFERQLFADSDPYDTVGMTDGPLDWRFNGGIDLSYKNWDLGWNTQYYDSYSIAFGDPKNTGGTTINVRNQGGDPIIPSQMYHDLRLRYRFDQGGRGIWSGLELTAGIQNVFDTRPPVIGATLGGYSKYGDPRLRRFSLSIRKPLNF